MLQPKRLPRSILGAWPPSKPFLPIPYCIRLASRWNPNQQKPRTRIRRREPPISIDPKANIPGWQEFKETLLRRARTQIEIEAIDQLSPEEVSFLMNPNAIPSTEDDTPHRILPANRNYFSGQAGVEQRLQDVEKMFERFAHLPKAPSHLWPVRDWKGPGANSLGDSSTTAEDSGAVKGNYTRAMNKLARELNKIHSVLMPKELQDWLNDVAPLRNVGGAGARQKRMLDKFERSRGNGKRKTARAKVQVLPGNGLIYVNGKLAAEHFTRTKDVENVIWPLQAVGVLGRYNVWISTWGGGTTGMCFEWVKLGQSEACKLAVARAMLAHDKSGNANTYRKTLRKGSTIRSANDSWMFES
jgi:ribosomal protein S9